MLGPQSEAVLGQHHWVTPLVPASRGRRESVLESLSHTRQMVVTSLPLVGVDVLSVLVATSAAAFVSCSVLDGYTPDLLAKLLLLSAAAFLVNLLFGLYPGVGLNPIVEYRQVCVAATLLFVLVGTASCRRPADAIFFTGAWALTVALAPVGRSVIRSLVCHCKWWGQPAIIFGSGTPAMKIHKALELNRGLGLRPVGLVDGSYTYGGEMNTEVELFSTNRAASEVRRRCVFWAIVIMPDRSTDVVARVIQRVFLQRYPQVLLVPPAGRLPSLWNNAHDCGGMPAVHVVERLLLPLPRAMKRLVDLAITIVGGLVLLPLIGFIAVAIKLSSPGPIFYSQQRIGRGYRHFRAWKFRTMARDAEQVLRDYLDSNPEMRAEWARDHKLKNDPRVTWIGHWLRKTSLDELPQLWNVLLGQMSLVGPRPIVDDEIGKYGETFELYKKVVPGVTGLWQVSGRNNTTYQERVDLDSFYVRNWSPWFDLYILMRTIKVVLLREGAY